MPTLAERVEDLVARVHGGRVNEASRDFGILPSTLSRILSGRTKSPSEDVLGRIARFYGVAPEWLLTGRGEKPSPLASFTAAYRRWVQALARVKLPLHVHEIWLELPFSTQALRLRIVPHRYQAGEGFNTASDVELFSWTAWLDAFIEEAGVHEVRRILSTKETIQSVLVTSAKWSLALLDDGAIKQASLKKIEHAYLAKAAERERD